MVNEVAMTAKDGRLNMRSWYSRRQHYSKRMLLNVLLSGAFVKQVVRLMTSSSAFSDLSEEQKEIGTQCWLWD